MPEGRGSAWGELSHHQASFFLYEIVLRVLGLDRQ